MSVETEIDWDVLYSALANNNRRTLLEYLLSKGDARPEELSRYLLRGGGEPTGTELTSMQIRLYHVDIPALERANLLTWDTEQNQVVPTGLASRLPNSIVRPSLSAPQAVRDEEEAVE